MVVFVWVNVNEDGASNQRQTALEIAAVKLSNGGVEWFSKFYEGDIEGGSIVPPHSVGPLLGELFCLLPEIRRHAI